MICILWIAPLEKLVGTVFFEPSKKRFDVLPPTSAKVKKALPPIVPVMYKLSPSWPSGITNVCKAPIGIDNNPTSTLLPDMLLTSYSSP
jgi:hypothetical protein